MQIGVKVGDIMTRDFISAKPEISVLKAVKLMVKKRVGSLILQEKDLELFENCCKLLTDEGVEYRVGTAGGGNQARQPYLEPYQVVSHDLSNVDHIHNFGLYIGNHPELTVEQIVNLCGELNTLWIY